MNTGVWWRYDLTENQQRRVRGNDVHGEDDISINVLELLGMVISAWVMVVLRRERPSGINDCVLLRGNNSSAVHWINQCRGGKEPRAGAILRFLGVLEMASEWHFQEKHVPGVLNDVADGIHDGHSSLLPKTNLFATRFNLAPAGPRESGAESLFQHFGVGFIRQAVARSSEQTYQGHFGAFVQFRRGIHEPDFLRQEDAEMEHVQALLVEYAAYACSVKGLRAPTIDNHMSAIKHFHRLVYNIDLPIVRGCEGPLM